MVVLHPSSEGSTVMIAGPAHGGRPTTPQGGRASRLGRGTEDADYWMGGWALASSSWNCSENQWPETGALGSAPLMLLPLRGLPS